MGIAFYATAVWVDLLSETQALHDLVCINTPVTFLVKLSEKDIPNVHMHRLLTVCKQTVSAIINCKQSYNIVSNLDK